MNWRVLAGAILLCGAAGAAGAVGRIADVAVYDRAENRPLPVYRYGGRYYVVGAPGNEYQLRVRNRSGADILAVVSVDGVNAVSGATADWNQTGYVLAPGQSHDIRGWRKSLDRTAAFFFTEHRNSYAARTGRPQNVGVIGVAVFRKRAEPEARIEQPRQPDELPDPGARDDSPYPASADSDSGAGASRAAESAAGPRRHAPAPQGSPALGTGHGRSEISRVNYAKFERATAEPEEVIAIQYDTYANLVALGVIRAPRFARPTPFPGQFVPDPR